MKTTNDRRGYTETIPKSEIERIQEAYFTFLYESFFLTPMRYWFIMFDKMFEKGNITYLE